MSCVTPDTGGEGGENSVKISGAYCLRFGIEGLLKIWRKRITRSLT